MALSNIPLYDVRSIEQKARETLIAQFGSQVPIPVDVELLIESLSGVDLDIWPGLRDNYGIEGMVARDSESGELLVFIDATLADTLPTRYRMTVAEELGHILLHRSVIEQINKPSVFVELQRHARWPEMDRNAKRFAAAILMPGEQLTKAAENQYPKLASAAGFGDVQAVKKYLASQLAKQFEVSAQAMNIRLTEWPMRIFTRVEQAMKDGMDYL